MGSTRRIEMSIAGRGKTARVDGKDARRPGDFFGHLRPVIFSPEEINLVRGAPAGRRALLDRALFQSDVNFLEHARAYDRHLRQRNRLLREEAGDRELAPWTEGFIRSGARLRLERFRYIQRLRPFLREAYSHIAGATEEAEVIYANGSGDEDMLIETLAQEVAGVANRERRMGQSLAGPHRDDPEFQIDSLPVRTYGSQGQQRSFLLAFKTAQIRDLEETTGEAPVLLLDDMTSELDRGRQELFFRYLLAREGQVFITTTDCRTLYEQGFSQARYLRVNKGRLENDSQR